MTFSYHRLSNSSGETRTLPRSSSMAAGLEKNGRARVQAIFSHAAGDNSTLLSFSEGDVITLLVPEARDGWHYGENEKNKMWVNPLVLVCFCLNPPWCRDSECGGYINKGLVLSSQAWLVPVLLHTCSAWERQREAQSEVSSTLLSCSDWWINGSINQSEVEPANIWHFPCTKGLRWLIDNQDIFHNFSTDWLIDWLLH